MTQAPDPETFRRRVDELLRELLLQLDSVDPDELEAEASEGVVKLTFGDGSRCVLNRQSAAQQIWLAEGATAWHFVADESGRRWIDTKGRGELREVLSSLIARKIGRVVSLD